MEKERQVKYWRTVAIGVIFTLFALVVVGLPWYQHRHDHVWQTQVQAAYLAELSSYPGKEGNPVRQSNLVKELVDITRWKAETNADIENYLESWFKLMKASMNFEPGSYIIRLIKEMPGAITESLQGNTAYAQQLEEKWIRTRNITFYPFGLTLMLIFLVGITITIIAAAPCEE